MLGITVEQFLEIKEFPPLDPKEIERQNVPGKTLVSPDDEKLLTTQMYKLHDWYMREVKDGREPHGENQQRALRPCKRFVD